MNGWLAILCITAVSLFSYRKTIGFGLISDDLLTAKITEPLHKNKWVALWNEFSSHRLNPDKAEKDPKKLTYRCHHICNLTIHTINCILIYILFSKLSSPNIGLITSLLFCINPITCQGGSVWISGRGYAHSTVYVLLMFLMPYIAPAWLYCASCFSSNSLFTPMLFMGTDNYYLALLLPLSLWFYKRVVGRVEENARGNSRASRLDIKKFIIAIKNYGFYFRNCIMPYNLSLYPSMTWGFGIGGEYDKKALKIDKDFWIGFIVVMFTLFNVIFNFNQFSYGLWWFSICIIMYCNLVTIQQGIAHRYTYLACIGLMYSVANLICSLPHPYDAYFFITLATFYYTRLWLHLPFWRNEYWYQEMNTVEDSKTPYSWIAKGVSKALTNNFVGALYDFREGENKARDNFGMKEFKAHLNMANMFYCIGDMNQAKDQLNKARDCMYDVDNKQPQLDMLSNLHNLILATEKTGVIDVNKVKIWK